MARLGRIGKHWSHLDGRHVAFVASRDGPYGNAVCVVNADGTTPPDHALECRVR